jgi:hypothetical protein
MSEQVLTVLKFCLLALLYLFLARVVWVVARELRGTPAPATVVAAPAPRSGRKPWRVVVVAPDAERGRDYWVDGEVTIGRGGGCAISLPSDTFLSQVHARIFDNDGTLWLEDLGSTNGTYLNGKVVNERVKLRKGDRVQVGETVFEASR